MSNTLFASINVVVSKKSSHLTKELILSEYIYLLNEFLIDKIEMKITTCNGEVTYVNCLDWDIPKVEVLDENGEEVK